MENNQSNKSAKGRYAPVNGLNMYYEVHGEGQPLVVLHGAFMTVNLMEKFIAGLAITRQVIAVELQGHGHTADIDRPLRYELLADDVAALLKHLQIEKADIFGYSLGGGVALQIAIRHPEVVRRLVVASATYNSAGLYPEVLANIEKLTPESFAGTSWFEEYNRVAPRPQDFPVLVEKMKELDGMPQDWPATSIQAIKSPALVIIGDSDGIRPEHAVELFCLLGGGVFGDLAGLPKAQLAILPGTTHVTIIDRTDWLVSMISQFLDAPLPATA